MERVVMADDALLALVRKLAGEARPLEQVEAYAARSHQTEVKVFGGEVESLSSADVDGVGVRVVVDGRQGFAWAGSLEPDIVAETLTEARDNAGFGSLDEHLGLPTPLEGGGADGRRAGRPPAGGHPAEDPPPAGRLRPAGGVVDPRRDRRRPQRRVGAEGPVDVRQSPGRDGGRVASVDRRRPHEPRGVRR